MKRAWARVCFAAVCLAALFSVALPVFAEGMQAQTFVTVTVEQFKITSQTDDFTLGVGESEELKVAASHAIQSASWEVSTDGGSTWAAAPSATSEARYLIQSAQLNRDSDGADVPYRYRVTVTNAFGDTKSAIISVLVSNDYAYRTIALRNGDTDVSAYMHETTRLVVSPADEQAAQDLKAQLPADTVAGVLCDVSLVNQSDQVVPYFGALQVDFHVGLAYDGQTLNVYHLHNGSIITYEGVVGAVESGVLSITVNVLSPFLVEVPAAITHVVAAGVAGTGGSISPAGDTSVADGGAKTFTFLPDVGFEIAEVVVDGSPVSFEGNSYTMPDVRADASIDVSFRVVAPLEVLHVLAVSSGSHGSVSPTGTLEVRHGDPQTFYFYPESGYELDKLLVNGQEVSVLANSYTISAVTADAAVQASFRSAATQPPDVYHVITASSDANGSISPAGSTSVEHGGGMYYYFIPRDGYEVDEVSVDGAPVASPGSSHQFVNVVGDHAIRVTFRQIVTPPPPPTTYVISASVAGIGGRISPDGEVRVTSGGSQLFTFVPLAGYEVDAVAVDGTVVAVSNGSYQFSNVTSGHTLQVSFKRMVVPPTPPEPTPPTPNPTPTAYFAIAASAGDHGSISPAGSVLVAAGGTAWFHFVPDDGYVVDALVVDGFAMKAPGYSYSFEGVASSHDIHVTFRQASVATEAVRYHEIAASAEGGGRISPSGTARVPHGGTQTFYLISDEGCKVAAIYVNGVLQDTTTTQFTLTNVTGSVSLRVVFERADAGGASTGSGAVGADGDAYGEACHCLWNRLLGTCALCALAGRCVTPWCWLVPLVVVLALAGGIGSVAWRKRRDARASTQPVNK